MRCFWLDGKGMMFRLVVGDEIEIRLHEESNVEELYALIERNYSYLKEWMAWADQGREESSEFVRGRYRISRRGKHIRQGYGIRKGSWAASDFTLAILCFERWRWATG
jgi:hypothetical protein